MHTSYWIQVFSIALKILPAPKSQTDSMWRQCPLLAIEWNSYTGKRKERRRRGGQRCAPGSPHFLGFFPFCVKQNVDLIAPRGKQTRLKRPGIGQVIRQIPLFPWAFEGRDTPKASKDFLRKGT